jgi:hypothetical protein
VSGPSGPPRQLADHLSSAPRRRSRITGYRNIAMTWGELSLSRRSGTGSWTCRRRNSVAWPSTSTCCKEQGVLLDEPYTRQLKGKLRELRFHLGREQRFHLGREQRRISYYIASERRIVLLTVFRKTRMREAGEVSQAETAMRLCIAEDHTAED